VLELTLGPTESAWGTRLEDVPPSLGPFGGNGTLPVNGSAPGQRRWAMPRMEFDFAASQ
jgi:hypothetical protein